MVAVLGSSGVSLSPKDFKNEMQSLASMSMEDAYVWGKEKNRYEEDWVHYSPRIQIPGLIGSLKQAAATVGTQSVATFTKHVSWQWLAKCQTDPVMSNTVKSFKGVRESVVSSIYTDLDQRLQLSDSYSFVRAEKLSARYTLYVPSVVGAALAECADSLGVSSNDCFQVGLCWVLSRSRKGLFASRVSGIYVPEVDKLWELAQHRRREFAEIKVVLEFRRKWDAEHEGVNTVTPFGVTTLTP